MAILSEESSKILPFCDEAEFYDNNGFEKVAEYRNGELRIIRRNPSARIDEFELFWKKV